MTKVNNIFISKIYFTLVAVLSLFSYSSEPLNTFNGKSLVCKANIGQYTCADYCPSPKDYGAECCTYDPEPRPHLPSEYIGFKFIEKTVSMDRLSEDNPSELSRKIVNIDIVEPYEARWCAEHESRSYKKYLIKDDPLSELLNPYPYFEEVKACTYTYRLKRDTGNVTHTRYRIVWENLDKEGLKYYREVDLGPFTYNCEVEEDLESYEYFLNNILIKEEKRLEDIETQKLEKLKKRKL